MYWGLGRFQPKKQSVTDLPQRPAYPRHKSGVKSAMMASVSNRPNTMAAVKIALAPLFNWISAIGSSVATPNSGPVVDNPETARTRAVSKATPVSDNRIVISAKVRANSMKKIHAINAPSFCSRRARGPALLTEDGCTSRSISRTPLR